MPKREWIELQRYTLDEPTSPYNGTLNDTLNEPYNDTLNGPLTNYNNNGNDNDSGNENGNILSSFSSREKIECENKKFSVSEVDDDMWDDNDYSDEVPF